jgi:hypothetical protein
MQISTKLNTVFVRIPKTASGSISHTITSLDPTTPEKNGIHHYHERFTEEHQQFFRNFFAFTVVRNTYDRLASWYYFEKKHTSTHSPNPLLKRRVKQDFCYWLKCLIEDYDPLLPVYCSNSFTSWCRICPYQLDYFTNKEREVLVNKVIDYKDIDTEIPKIIGAPVEVRKHVVGTYDKKSFLGQKEYDLINQIYEEELDYFKWKI